MSKVADVIVFDGVTKMYPTSTRPAVDNLTWRVDKGEFVFVIGPSGSGKSTVFNLLMAKEKPTEGDIHFGDLHVNTLNAKSVTTLRQRIGYVFQDFRLLPRLNAYDNVAFAMQVVGAKNNEISQRVPEVLDLVGLEAKADRMPQELSGGEQQRIAIARAIVNTPDALIADEPTGNLDPHTADEIIALLQRINRAGTTVVMSTHNARAVNQLRERVVELRLGKLLRDDQRGVYTTAE